MEAIKNNNAFSFISNDTYIALSNCTIDGIIFNKGDKITFQESTLQNLDSYKKYIHDIQNSNADEVVYFSLNESTLSHFPSSKIIELK